MSRVNLLLSMMFCMSVLCSQYEKKWSPPLKWHDMTFLDYTLKENEAVVSYKLHQNISTIHFYKKGDYWYQSVVAQRGTNIHYERSLPINIDDALAKSLLSVFYGSVDGYIKTVKLDSFDCQQKLTVPCLNSLSAAPLFSYANSKKLLSYMQKNNEIGRS